MLQNTTRTRSAALLSAPSSKSKVDNILVKDTDLCINIVCQIVCHKTIRLNSTKRASVRTTDIFLQSDVFFENNPWAPSWMSTWTDFKVPVLCEVNNCLSVKRRMINLCPLFCFYNGYIESWGGKHKYGCRCYCMRDCLLFITSYNWQILV